MDRLLRFLSPWCNFCTSPTPMPVAIGRRKGQDSTDEAANRSRQSPPRAPRYSYMKHCSSAAPRAPKFPMQRVGPVRLRLLSLCPQLARGRKFLPAVAMSDGMRLSRNRNQVGTTSALLNGGMNCASLFSICTASQEASAERGPKSRSGIGAITPQIVDPRKHGVPAFLPRSTTDCMLRLPTPLASLTCMAPVVPSAFFHDHAAAERMHAISGDSSHRCCPKALRMRKASTFVRLSRPRTR